MIKVANLNPRTRLNPEQRKQHILDAAIVVFARRGIGCEDLVSAVLGRVENFILIITKHHQTQQATTDPLATLQNHSFRFLKLAQNNADMVKICLEWNASVRDELWPRYIDFQNPILDIIEPTNQVGVDMGQMHAQLTARDLALILYGQAHPVTLATFAPNPPIQNMLRFVQLGMHALLGIQNNSQTDPI